MGAVSRGSFLRAGLAAAAGSVVGASAAPPAVQAQAGEPLLRQYFDEGFNDWVQSGGDIVGVSALQVNVTEAVIYVNGQRVTVPSASFTLSPNADTYFDAGVDGVVYLTPALVGGAAPALQPNRVRLGFVTTGAAITRSVDLRLETPVAHISGTTATPLMTLEQLGNGHVLDMVVGNSNSAGIYIERTGRSAALYIMDESVDPAGTWDLIDIENHSGGDGVFVLNKGTGGGFKVQVYPNPQGVGGVGFQAQVWKGVGITVQNLGDATAAATAEFSNTVAATGPVLALGGPTGNGGRIVNLFNAGVGDGIAVTQIGNGRGIAITQHGSQTAMQINKLSSVGGALAMVDWSSGPALAIDKRANGIGLFVYKPATAGGDLILLDNKGTGNDITGSGATWRVTKDGYGEFKGGIRTKLTTAPPVLLNDGDHQVYWDGTDAWACWRVNGVVRRVRLDAVSAQPAPATPPTTPVTQPTPMAPVNERPPTPVVPPPAPRR